MCISGPGQTRLCPSLLLGLERSANLTDNAQKQSFSKPGSRTKTRSDKKHLWKIRRDTLTLGSNSTQGGQGHHLLGFYAVGLGEWSDEAFSCSYVSPLWPQQWGPSYPSEYSLPEPLEVRGGRGGTQRALGCGVKEPDLCSTGNRQPGVDFKQGKQANLMDVLGMCFTAMWRISSWRR